MQRLKFLYNCILLGIVGSSECEADVRLRRMKWKDESMKKAIEAVSSKEMTVSAASRVFNVPRKTLDDRIKGSVVHGQKPGPKTALSPEEEESLANYLLYMADLGFPLTRTMVKAFAWAIAKRSGKEKRFNTDLGPSEHWWQLFKKRHTEIALRKSDKLDRNRAEAFNETIVNEYFDLLEKKMEELGITTHPRQIYNCDETFLPLDYTRERVVAARGAKAVYSQSTGTTDHITLLCCGSAAGLPLPPMIIYAKSFPGGQYRFQGPDDALYAKSDSGWIDTELFMTWFNKIFLKYAVSQRPLLLVVDGHKSHITLDIIDKCRENEIVLFCLPPHTTHALQPLDVAVFKSLKDHYSKAVRVLSFAKKNFVVTRREFSKVLKSPFERAFSIPNIKSGFAKSGIYPLNRDAIAKSKMKPSLVHRSWTSSDSDSPLPQSSSASSTPISPPTPASVTPLTPTQSSSASSTPISPPTPASVTPLTPAQSSSASSTQESPPTPALVAPPTPTENAPSSVPPAIHTPVSRPAGIVNPLVAAGLITADLVDILVAPAEDDAVPKKRTKRITGARDLTSEEYREMLAEDKRKKVVKEREKQKRKEERENRKSKQTRSGRGRGSGRPTRRRLNLESDSESNDNVEQSSDDIERSLPSDRESPQEMDTDTNGDADQSARTRPSRQRTLPSRFRQDSSNEDNDGAICVICKKNEPEGVAGTIVFWIDCNDCGDWAHNFCAFSNNTASRQYYCPKCSTE